MSSCRHSKFVHFTNNLAEINRLAQSNPEKLVSRSDQHYHDSIHSMAEKIVERGCRVVLLAGPSSSGKTTTAHFIRDALEQIGHPTEMISLDDFYREEKDTPLRPDGQHDFECLDALRVDCIQQCIGDLMRCGSCEVPQFDFMKHTQSPQPRKVVLGSDGIAVIEGLHALNPRLTQAISSERIARIYISVKQDVFNGNEELLDAHEIRIVRRLVRDYNFRGTSPERTLEMWDSVMDGERQYIAPYKYSADFTVNSLHAYELGVLRTPALMLLHGVSEQDGWVGEEIRRLSFALMLFTPVDAALLPPTSLIREFIGGGLYN